MTTHQRTLVRSDFTDGQISACEIFEDYILEQERQGRVYWSGKQIYDMIRSVRLNLQELFK